MEIKIYFKDEADQFGQDASFSLGWISVVSGEMEISFFKRKYCMIFLTLSSLVESLQSLKKNKKTINWIGEDNGDVVQIQAKNNNVCFVYNEINVSFPFDQFTSDLISHGNLFLRRCMANNVNISTESAFKDLSHVLNFHNIKN